MENVNNINGNEDSLAKYLRILVGALDSKSHNGTPKANIPAQNGSSVLANSTEPSFSHIENDVVHKVLSTPMNRISGQNHYLGNGDALSSLPSQDETTAPPPGLSHLIDETHNSTVTKLLGAFAAILKNNAPAEGLQHGTDRDSRNLNPYYQPHDGYYRPSSRYTYHPNDYLPYESLHPSQHSRYEMPRDNINSRHVTGPPLYYKTHMRHHSSEPTLPEVEQDTHVNEDKLFARNLLNLINSNCGSLNRCGKQTLLSNGRVESLTLPSNCCDLTLILVHAPNCIHTEAITSQNENVSLNNTVSDQHLVELNTPRNAPGTPITEIRILSPTKSPLPQIDKLETTSKLIDTDTKTKDSQNDTASHNNSLNAKASLKENKNKSENQQSTPTVSTLIVRKRGRPPLHAMKSTALLNKPDDDSKKDRLRSVSVALSSAVTDTNQILTISTANIDTESSKRLKTSLKESPESSSPSSLLPSRLHETHLHSALKSLQGPIPRASTTLTASHSSISSNPFTTTAGSQSTITSSGIVTNFSVGLISVALNTSFTTSASSVTKAPRMKHVNTNTITNVTPANIIQAGVRRSATMSKFSKRIALSAASNIISADFSNETSSIKKAPSSVIISTTTLCVASPVPTVSTLQKTDAKTNSAIEIISTTTIPNVAPYEKDISLINATASTVVNEQPTETKINLTGKNLTVVTPKTKEKPTQLQVALPETNLLESQLLPDHNSLKLESDQNNFNHHHPPRLAFLNSSNPFPTPETSQSLDLKRGCDAGLPALPSLVVGNRGSYFYGRRRKKHKARRYIKWTREKMLEADAWIEEAIRREKANPAGVHKNCKIGKNSGPSTSTGTQSVNSGSELSLLNVKKLSEILNVSLSSIYKYLRLTRPDFEGGPRKSLVHLVPDPQTKGAYKHDHLGLGKGGRRGRPPGLNGTEYQVCNEIKRIVEQHNVLQPITGQPLIASGTSATYIEDLATSNVVAYMSVSDIMRRLPPSLRCSRVSLKKYLGQLRWNENRTRRSALMACNSETAATTKAAPSTKSGSLASSKDGTPINTTYEKLVAEMETQMGNYATSFRRDAAPSLLNIPNFYSNLNLQKSRNALVSSPSTTSSSMPKNNADHRLNTSSISTNKQSNGRLPVDVQTPVTLINYTTQPQKGGNAVTQEILANITSNLQQLQNKRKTIIATNTGLTSTQSIVTKGVAGTKLSAKIDNLLAQKQSSNGTLVHTNPRITNGNDVSNNLTHTHYLDSNLDPMTVLVKKEMMDIDQGIHNQNL